MLVGAHVPLRLPQQHFKKCTSHCHATGMPNQRVLNTPCCNMVQLNSFCFKALLTVASVFWMFSNAGSARIFTSISSWHSRCARDRLTQTSRTHYLSDQSVLLRLPLVQYFGVSSAALQATIPNPTRALPQSCHRHNMMVSYTRLSRHCCAQVRLVIVSGGASLVIVSGCVRFLECHTV